MTDARDLPLHPVALLFPEMGPDEYADFAADVARRGLLEPVSTWRGRVVDGRHRQRACRELGVPCPARECDCDEAGLVALVVSRNVRRRHLSESQRALLAARLANLRPGRPGKPANLQVSRPEAAGLLNVSERSVASAAKVLGRGTPELVAAVLADEIAVSRAARIADADPAEQNRIVAGYDEDLIRKQANGLRHRDKAARRAARERRDAAAAAEVARLPADARYAVLPGDFRDADVAAGSVDVVVTDPPYPAEHLPLYGDLTAWAARVLKPGGSLLAMCGQSHLPEVLDHLRRHLTYHWAASYLTPGGQAVQVWPRKVNTFWKPVLWFTNGPYAGGWVGDVCRSATNGNDKRFHGWGQSESGMADLVERFSRPGDLVADPFTGGGTTGVAAVRLGRRFLGVEVDPAVAAAALARIGREAAALREGGPADETPPVGAAAG